MPLYGGMGRVHTPHIPTYERAALEAQKMRDAGYEDVRIVKDGPGYQVTAQNKSGSFRRGAR